jgi:hypothetical protein
VARGAGEAIAIERHGDALLLQSGTRSARCTASGLAARVGVALRVRAAARVSALRVTRL